MLWALVTLLKTMHHCPCVSGICSAPVPAFINEHYYCESGNDGLLFIYYYFMARMPKVNKQSVLAAQCKKFTVTS